MIRGGSRILPALLLIALFVACQMAGLLHMAMVRHAVCPADGDLIHPGSDGRAALRSAAPDEKQPASLAARSTAHAEHGHDHCLLAAQRGSEKLVRPVRQGALPAPAAPAPPGSTQEAPRCAGFIALFRLAPKTSPPV